MASRASNVTVVNNTPSKICVFYTGYSIEDLGEIVHDLTGSYIHLAKYMTRKVEQASEDEAPEFETYGVLATISEQQFRTLEKGGYTVNDYSNEFSVVPYEYLDEKGENFKSHLVPDPKQNQSWSINVMVPPSMGCSKANRSMFDFTRQLLACKIVKARPDIYFPRNSVEDTHQGYMYLNPKAETPHEEIVKMMVLLKGRPWNDESKFTVRTRWALSRDKSTVLNPEADTSLHKPLPPQTKGRKVRAPREEKKTEEAEGEKTPSDEIENLSLDNTQNEVDADGFKTVKPKVRGKRAEALKAADEQQDTEGTVDL